MKALNLTFLHLSRMLKNKGIFFGTLLIPTFVICLVVFFTKGVSSTASINFNVVNLDKGIEGRKLISELQHSHYFNVSEQSMQEAQNNVKTNSSAVALVIPEKFTSDIKAGINPVVKIFKTKDGNMDSPIQTNVNSYILKSLIASKVNKTLIHNGIKPDISALEKIGNEQIHINSSVVVNNKSLSLSNALAINLVISFIMYSMIFIINEILSLRKNGTLRRSLSTPNKNGTILSSLLLSFLFVGWIQLLLFIGITRFVLKVNWGSSFLALFLVTTSLLLVELSLALLLCRWVKNETTAAVIVNMVATITGMLSGCFMSLDYMPAFFQRLALFTPQNWAMTAINDIVLKNKGVLSVLPNIGILLLFSLAFFTAAASSTKNIVNN